MTTAARGISVRILVPFPFRVACLVRGSKSGLTIKITDERHPKRPESRTDVRAAHSVHRLVSPCVRHLENLSERSPKTVPRTKSRTSPRRDAVPVRIRPHGQNGGSQFQTRECAPSANHIQLSIRRQPTAASTLPAVSMGRRLLMLADASRNGRATAQMTSATMDQSIVRIGRDSCSCSCIGLQD